MLFLMNTTYGVVYAFLLLVLALLIFLAIKQKKIIWKICISVITVLVLVPELFLGCLILVMSYSIDTFYQTMLLISALFVIISIVFAVWGLYKYKVVTVTVISILLIGGVVTSCYAGYNAYIDSVPTLSESSDILSRYAPDSDTSKVAVLENESSFTLHTDIPKLDGATALYPVYSAFAKAVYPDFALNYEYVDCTTTSSAYERIVTGETDIVFVAAPSENQKQYAADHGVELEYTPIGSEGFVFFVNAKNPLDDLSIEQVQNIYSGEITQWSELGIERLGEIIAFQRDEGSGSQSALQRMMKDKTLVTPPTDRVVEAMTGIIEKTSDYKNFKNAIGFSFRFYSTEMVKSNHIKLLSLNGVYPSEENIRNGTYPISNNFYAVTRKDKSENVKKFLDWMTGEEAQYLVEQTGYIPIS